MLCEICRHGLKQFRNGWADGPAYITQCPIQSGSSYSYDFNITGQRGTLWWHAHILWLRATVYGAIVIMPKQGIGFPFPQPQGETVLVLGKILRRQSTRKIVQFLFLVLAPVCAMFNSLSCAGEWWNSDVETLVKQGNALGLPPNMSDAHTINGKPGPLFPCSDKRM